MLSAPEVILGMLAWSLTSHGRTVKSTSGKYYTKLQNPCSPDEPSKSCSVPATVPHSTVIALLMLGKGGDVSNELVGRR